MTVPALMQQLAFRRPLHRKTAQYEWSGSEAKGLVRGLPFGSDQFQCGNLSEGLLRYNQTGIGLLEDRPGRFKAGLPDEAQWTDCRHGAPLRPLPAASFWRPRGDWASEKEGAERFAFPLLRLLR